MPDISHCPINPASTLHCLFIDKNERFCLLSAVPGELVGNFVVHAEEFDQCTRIESTAFFNDILGVQEKILKCAVRNAQQVCTSSAHILVVIK